MMYALNKVMICKEFLDGKVDVEVLAIAYSCNREELEDIKRILENQPVQKWEGDICEYDIVEVRPITEIHKRTGFDFEKVLHDIIAIGIDIVVDRLTSENLDISHLPIGVDMDEDSQIVLTFEEGNKKRLIIEDI